MILLHGESQGGMPHPVEGIFEVNKNVLQALLVFEMFLTDISEVELLFYGIPETHLFFLL